MYLTLLKRISPCIAFQFFFLFMNEESLKRREADGKLFKIKDAEGFILNLISNYFEFRLNNCVGHYNHRYFFLYMLFMCIGKSSFRCRPCFNRPLPSQLSEYNFSDPDRVQKPGFGTGFQMLWIWFQYPDPVCPERFDPDTVISDPKPSSFHDRELLNTLYPF